MTLELVATDDLKVAFSNTSGPPGLVYTSDPGLDPVKVVAPIATKCSNIATTSIVITWAAATPCPHTSATHTFIAGAAVVQASSVSTRAEGALVLRVGDSSAVGCVGSWAPPGGGSPVVCNCGVEISDAGQTKVKSE